MASYVSTTDLIARTIQLHPSTASQLLRVNSRFYSAACKTLYEELYLQDDTVAFSNPMPCTRYSIVAERPEKYALYVRSLIIIPASIGRLFHFREEDASTCARHITAKEFAPLVEMLPNLEMMVW